MNPIRRSVSPAAVGPPPARLSGDGESSVCSVFGDHRDDLRLAFTRLVRRSGDCLFRFRTVAVEVPDPLLRDSGAWIHHPFI